MMQTLDAGHLPSRDLAGYGQHPPHPHWPGNARIALQFVLNDEEGAERSVLDGDPHAETFLSEIARHGWRWLSYQDVPEDIEREHLARAVTTIQALTGQPLLGWYTGRDSPNTRRLVAEHGGFPSGGQFLAHLRDAFDCLYAEGGDAPRMLSVGLHCRLVGRPARRVDIARHWAATRPASQRSDEGTAP